MRRVLTLVGWSVALPFADLVESGGFAAELVDPLDVDASALERGGFDAILAVGHPGLPLLSPPQAWGEAICRFVAEGGGLVSCRGALDWFEGWDGWPRFLGARRTEERVLVDLTGGLVLPGPPVHFDAHRHPLVAGLHEAHEPDGPLPRCQARPGTQVLARAEDAPAVWTVPHGAGHVVVDLLAYDEDSLSLPANKVVLQRALRWVGEG